MMLADFECDEDRTGWLSGNVLWATGAAAGCLLAVSTNPPPLEHLQVLCAAMIVSAISVGLRLPVLTTQCPVPAWLAHAAWLFGIFAQVNWTGFIAARAPTVTIACEGVFICLGLEAWLTWVLLRNQRLNWLGSLLRGSTEAPLSSLTSSQVNASAVHREGALRPSSSTAAGLVAAENETELDDIRREYVDGFDEQGVRYLSGTVRITLDAGQRHDVILLSFCPALDAPALLETECDSEEAIIKVEHTTETGARISVRRTKADHALHLAIDWFAQAQEADASQSNMLP